MSENEKPPLYEGSELTMDDAETAIFSGILDNMWEVAGRAGLQTDSPMSFTMLLAAAMTTKNPEWWGRMAFMLMKTCEKLHPEMLEHINRFVEHFPEALAIKVEELPLKEIRDELVAKREDEAQE